ncbi:hypothetical protein B0I35DRAFT_437529 [Stachybotrys elegans]|uniref:F-box domain-containing protein n=1 Tax=Stachybotrys elegans TaxID=80388 RepID=A0A8K0SMZ5_9HYPO|nr:hypothetical protein B0I35DRAFT_437529 [Stachybotrys elegans]
MPSFLELPLESIVEALCLRCCPLHRPYDINTCPQCYTNPSNGPECSTALANLCLTSRTLNAIATPHLYHYPMCSRWWLLLRTFIQNRDLARHVRHLRNDTWTLFSDIRPSVVRNEFAEVLAYRRQKAQDYVGILDDFDTQTFLQVELQVDENFEANIPIDLMMSLCTNVETIDATVYWGYIFASLMQPMPRLRELNISHGDSEYGIYMEGVAPLAALMPRLDSMLCHAVTSCGNFSHPLNLTTLVLQHSSISSPSLINILEACPHLEIFEYDAGGMLVGYEQFSPNQAQVGLTLHSKRLRVLSLDLDLDNTGAGITCDYDWVMDSLVELDKLQHLSVDTRCVVIHPDPYHNRQARTATGAIVPFSRHTFRDPEPTMLMELLPPSIRTIHIKQGPKGPPMQKLRTALSRLAVVRKDLFPNLQHVEAHGMNPAAVEELTRSFALKGVTFKG